MATSSSVALPRPKFLMFSGDRIAAKGIAGSFSFRGKVKPEDNMMIAFKFQSEPGAKGVVYAVPDNSPHKVGALEDIPEGMTFTFMRAITPATMPWIVKALRAAGWTGLSLKDLHDGKMDGFGSKPVSMKVVVKETDEKGAPLLDDKGNFRPQVEVAFVNGLNDGPVAFKVQATPSDLSMLDREFSSFLTEGAMRSAVGGNSGGGGNVSQPHTSAPPAPINEDDIPF